MGNVVKKTAVGGFTNMQMTFDLSSSVTLLFDSWDVHGATGMVLSVLVVFLLTVLYELLKMWRVCLGRGPRPANQELPCSISEAASDSSHSESSLVPMVTPPPPYLQSSWQLHVVQTALHVLQVSLGYMLMLCVMSYNTWIFLGVVLGSVLAYFVSFPLLGQDRFRTGG